MNGFGVPSRLAIAISWKLPAGTVPTLVNTIRYRGPRLSAASPESTSRTSTIHRSIDAGSIGMITGCSMTVVEQ